MRWLKFTAGGQTSWGIVEGDRVTAVSGDPFGEWQRTPRAHALAEVKIELPLKPPTSAAKCPTFPIGPRSATARRTR